MKHRVVKRALPVLVLGAVALGGGVARAGAPAKGAAPAATAGDAGETHSPKVVKKLSKGWGVAEIGIGGTVIGGGGSLAATFVGPVLTLQGARYRPIGVVFQFGAGVGLYGDTIPDPVDADAAGTDLDGMFFVALGVRIRPLAFGRGPERPFDLFVGPLVMVFTSHDMVTLAGAAEVGAAYRFGRFQVSLAVHGGYAHLMHQYPYADVYEFKTEFVVGGQVSFGLRF